MYFAYSLLLLGDTQYVNDRHPDNFIKIYDWIVNNVEAHKIKYVMGLGDVTEASGEAEWIRAKEQFDRYPGEELSAIGLGEIYAYGLGVPVDIKKAMESWNLFSSNPRVIENKKNFKKTLFGWKRVAGN